MRVLHLGKYFPPHPGGVEYFLADLLPALAAQGIEVAALIHHERAGWRGLWPKGEGDLPVYRAPTLGQWLYAPLSPAFPLWLQRVIEQFKPDLLHLHLPNTSAFWALALPAARRLPWVVHWHADVVASQLDRRLRLAYTAYRPLEQALLARTRQIIVTSPDYLDSSQPLAPWRARCTVIPLGLDPDRLADPDPESRRLAEGLWERVRPASIDHLQAWRVLAIGRLTYYKGHEVLIRAVAHQPEIGLLIVGAGPLARSLSHLVASLGLGGRVQLLGHQPDPLTQALLASCDLLALPSLERTEAFGLVQLEAMRFAKPVVVSDIPGSGVGWLIRQVGHGVAVAPGDSIALAQAIYSVTKDQKWLMQLGAKGKKALYKRFSIDAVAKKVNYVYAKILDQAVNK
ncbi:glycosyltransferase [Caldichromatium japonicum]|nr:glycosyltransferase [Caldichromatium japonicum]